MGKHQQLSHPEATVMGGMFPTTKPSAALANAVERMDDDARGLACEVGLQEPDIAHQVYLPTGIALQLQRHTFELRLSARCTGILDIYHSVIFE